MQQTFFIATLTSLRGFAALLVVLHHYVDDIAPVLGERVSNIPAQLHLMVDLFFILSGFIMSHVYGDSFKEKISWKTLSNFISARFARVYPLHFATLILTIFIGAVSTICNLNTLITGAVYDFSAIPSQLILLNGMGTHIWATWNSASWSLSVEWWTYFIFPILALLLNKNRIWSSAVLFLFVISGYYLTIYYFQPHFVAALFQHFNMPSDTPMPKPNIGVFTGAGAFVRCVSGFIYGMLLYEVFRSEIAKKIFASSHLFLLCWVSLFALWHFDMIPDFAAVFVLGIIIICAAHNNDYVERTLRNGFWQHMGVISFSIYLIHFPLIFIYLTARAAFVNLGVFSNPDFGLSQFEAWIGMPFFFALVIGMATLSYRFIEQPARAYFRKILQTTR